MADVFKGVPTLELVGFAMAAWDDAPAGMDLPTRVSTLRRTIARLPGVAACEMVAGRSAIPTARVTLKDGSFIVSTPIVAISHPAGRAPWLPSIEIMEGLCTPGGVSQVAYGEWMRAVDGNSTGIQHGKASRRRGQPGQQLTD
jgi:hypothetical protein